MTGTAQRALVLGGGGPVGIAWEVGLAAGLKEAGVDVTLADRILGTSAGSFVGAQLALGIEPGVLAELHAAAAGQVTAQPSESAPLLTLIAQFSTRIPRDAAPGEQLLRELGQAALGAETMPEEDFIARFAGMFPTGLPWPERFGCTAVNTGTGATKIWGAADGVPIERAVVSSCSVPGVYPPITIQGSRWMDGGARSWTNADLVTGARRVLVMAVVTPVWEPLARPVLAREQAAIEAAGGKVAIVTPDPDSLAVFGPDLLAVTRAPRIIPVAMAQGRREAERLRALWA